MHCGKRRSGMRSPATSRSDQRHASVTAARRMLQCRIAAAIFRRMRNSCDAEELGLLSATPNRYALPPTCKR